MAIKKNKKKALDESRQDIILHEEASFQVKEAYKAMRTNVMFSVPEEGCKIIAVTSPSPGDGKSTTILNLAITFAQTGKQVLVIDGDLRRPNIRRYLDSKIKTGLSDVLGHFNTLDETIHETKYENLYVLYSGNIPPNPAELLSGKTMQHVLETLKTRYDYIFIDMPPINVVTDAAVLSGIVNGFIVVVRQNETRKYELHEAIQRLMFVKAKVLGIVLNDKEYQHKSGYRRYVKYGKNKNYYVRDYV